MRTRSQIDQPRTEIDHEMIPSSDTEDGVLAVYDVHNDSKVDIDTPAQPVPASNPKSPTTLSSPAKETRIPVDDVEESKINHDFRQMSISQTYDYLKDPDVSAADTRAINEAVNEPIPPKTGSRAVISLEDDTARSSSITSQIKRMYGDHPSRQTRKTSTRRNSQKIIPLDEYHPIPRQPSIGVFAVGLTL